jgi:hypothetical protein
MQLLGNPMSLTVKVESGEPDFAVIYISWEMHIPKRSGLLAQVTLPGSACPIGTQKNFAAGTNNSTAYWTIGSLRKCFVQMRAGEDKIMLPKT